MLVRTLFFLVSISVSATQLPAIVKMLTERPQEPAVVAAAPKPVPVAASIGSVVLKGDAQGHFNASFRINGKTVDGLIDTGASSVAINEATARRLGFGVNSLDFKYPVSTANGRTMAAVVKLDRVEIGNIRVRDVEAVVLKNEALSGTLIGMTFLKQLSSFKVTNGTLQLVR
jgi:aspartyl protease family protein